MHCFVSHPMDTTYLEKPRPESRGGGIAVYHRIDIKTSPISMPCSAIGKVCLFICLDCLLSHWGVVFSYLLVSWESGSEIAQY